MGHKTKFTVMGCGGSGGVPYAGNWWGKCDPSNPRNNRMRPSLLIESKQAKVVIDTGPDFRFQINAAGVQGHLDAVLYTHAHFDHIMGMDDLRAFWFRNDKQQIQAYASEETAAHLNERFDYIFNQLSPQYPAIAKLNPLPKILHIKDLEIHSFNQIHGDMVTTGFRVGDFAYCTDVKLLPVDSLKALEGIHTWVVGVYPDADGQYNHAGLDQLYAWIDQLKPQMTYLTHLTANADYQTLCDMLPPHIRPAHDGLVIEL